MAYLCIVKAVRVVYFILLVISAFAVSGCKGALSATEGGRDTASPVPVILDIDIGSSTDDLFAMQLLYRYQERGQCRILGMVVDRMGDSCAMLADLMNTYYGHPDIPIGLERTGIPAPVY